MYDLDATYRRKGKQESRGYVNNVVETCNPDNDIQILTDVSIDQNIVDDGTLLSDRLEDIKKETDVQTLIADGGYDRNDLETNCDENEIDTIFTGIPGKAPEKGTFTSFHFKIIDKQILECPTGNTPLITEYNEKKEEIIAKMDLDTCKNCPMQENCPGFFQKKYYKITFTLKKLRVDIRRHLLKEDDEYKNKCRLRPAVEGTVWQFKKDMRNGKVRFRGFIKIKVRMILKGIGINFKRLVKREKDLIKSDFFYLLTKLFQYFGYLT